MGQGRLAALLQSGGLAGAAQGASSRGGGECPSADAARPFGTARHSDPVCCLLSLVSGFLSQRNAVKLGGAYQSHAFPFPYQCHPQQEQERLDGVKSLNACQG